MPFSLNLNKSTCYLSLCLSPNFSLLETAEPSGYWSLWGTVRSSPCQSPSVAPTAAHLFTAGLRKQETRDCKRIKILLGVCPSSHRCEDPLPYPEVFWNLSLRRVSFLLSLCFTAPVSSMPGLLSLPLRWVFFTFSFRCRSVC